MTTADKLRKEGRQEGIAKGRQEGIAKGVEKGKIENSIEIAEKMLREGLPHAIIEKITGIAPSEISKKRSCVIAK